MVEQMVTIVLSLESLWLSALDDVSGAFALYLDSFSFSRRRISHVPHAPTHYSVSSRSKSRRQRQCAQPAQDKFTFFVYRKPVRVGGKYELCAE